MITMLNDQHPIQIGQPLISIGQISIFVQYPQAFFMQIPKIQAVNLANYIYDICMRSTEPYVLINELLVQKSDIKKYIPKES